MRRLGSGGQSGGGRGRGPYLVFYLPYLISNLPCLVFHFPYLICHPPIWSSHLPIWYSNPLSGIPSLLSCIPSPHLESHPIYKSPRWNSSYLDIFKLWILESTKLGQNNCNRLIKHYQGCEVNFGSFFTKQFNWCTSVQRLQL